MVINRLTMVTGTDYFFVLQYVITHIC